jgi:hypothetical protein
MPRSESESDSEDDRERKRSRHERSDKKHDKEKKKKHDKDKKEKKHDKERKHKDKKHEKREKHDGGAPAVSISEPITEEEPPAFSMNSTLDTIADSSSTVKHAVHTVCPEDSSVSVCPTAPQLRQGMLMV